MDYADIDNHTIRSAVCFADPIARKLLPASAFFGFLVIIASGPLQGVFENALLESVARITLPLALAVTFACSGVAMLVPGLEGSLLRCARIVASYWANFTIGVCAAFLGVMAGVFLPYAIGHGASAALRVFSVATLFGAGIGFFAHYAAVIAHSDWFNNRRRVRLSSALGLIFSGVWVFCHEVITQLDQATALLTRHCN